ncbi:MAG: transcription antitermination protein NusG [Promethearchaeota archaeon CR_4]|nr:MAG: transcription antitermination protein NusG [Candidatus Lokiarchaeota archaeon CR_4]
MLEEPPQVTTLFAVRTTIGQEKSVANMIFGRLRLRDPVPDIKAILVAEQLRGYVFIEAIQQNDVQESISGIRHVKGKIVGSIKLTDLAHVITPRKVTEILEESDIVEISSGIFQNRRAVIERMPREGAKEDVVVRLMDSDSPISIKVHGDYLKLLEKGKALARTGAEVPVEARSQMPSIKLSEGGDLDIFSSLEKEMGLSDLNEKANATESEEGKESESELLGAESLEVNDEVLAAGAEPEVDPEVLAGAKQEKLERRRKDSDSGKDLFFDDNEEDWTDLKEEDEEDSY